MAAYLCDLTERENSEVQCVQIIQSNFTEAEQAYDTVHISHAVDLPEKGNIFHVSNFIYYRVMDIHNVSCFEEAMQFDGIYSLSGRVYNICFDIINKRVFMFTAAEMNFRLPPAARRLIFPTTQYQAVPEERSK